MISRSSSFSSLQMSPDASLVMKSRASSESFGFFLNSPNIVVRDSRRRRSATGASNPRHPHRHSAYRRAPVRWTDWFSHQCPERLPMRKTANETCHKSVFDRMAGRTGWFWASWSCVVILLSCYPV